jgi:leucyl aminopeptidase
MARLRIARDARRAEARVLPVLEGQVPEAWQAAAAAEGFTGAADTAALVFDGEQRVLLVGVDPAADRAAFEAAGALAASRLLTLRRVALVAAGLAPAQAVALATGAVLRAWRFDAGRTQPDPELPLLARFDLVGDEAVAQAWAEAKPVVAAVRFARDLVATPSDRLTPKTFARRLRRLKRHGVAIEVLKPRALRREKLGLIEAVGQGSANRPRLVVLRWAGEGAPEGPPIAFVGKGITFDTGGICIKPADRMWEMRADMAGAAACAGAILALARARAPVRAIAVLALAENAVGAASYRPGDVLTSFSGRTVEVIDTDAEGRLVLADALAWAVARETPAALVDVATLTGSMVVTLGHVMAGLVASDDALAERVLAAGEATGEWVWRLPLPGPGEPAIESDIADLRQCSPERMQPDGLQAAAFLHRFTGGVPWAHLDIAGVDTQGEADAGHAAGASGFGVRLLASLAGLQARGEPPRDTAWGRQRPGAIAAGA